MADLFRLTEAYARITANYDEQPLYTAVDVLAYDSLDVLITAAFEAPGVGAVFGLTLVSGIETSSSDSWVVAGSPSPMLRVTTPTVAFSVSGGFFRYLRWRVTTFEDATAACFTIAVVGRKNA